MRRGVLVAARPESSEGLAGGRGPPGALLISHFVAATTSSTCRWRCGRATPIRSIRIVLRQFNRTLAAKLEQQPAQLLGGPLLAWHSAAT